MSDDRSTDRPAVPLALETAPPEEIRLPSGTLRRWQIEDAEGLQAAVAASLPELRPFMAWATDDHGLEQSREYIARSVAEWDLGENFNYAILTADDEVAGSTGLMTRMGPGVLEIGYWIDSRRTGAGVATAAAAALADVGLSLPAIETVAIKHDAANTASGRVAEKAGFTRAGAVPKEPRAPGETDLDWVWHLRRTTG